MKRLGLTLALALGLLLLGCATPPAPPAPPVSVAPEATEVPSPVGLRPLQRMAAQTERIAPVDLDRKSTRLNSSHSQQSRMPSSA